MEATLFGESAGVVLLSVLPERTNEVLRRLATSGLAAVVAGPTGGDHLRLAVDGNVVVDERVADAEAAWGNALELALQGRPAASLAAR